MLLEIISWLSVFGLIYIVYRILSHKMGRTICRMCIRISYTKIISLFCGLFKRGPGMSIAKIYDNVMIFDVIHNGEKYKVSIPYKESAIARATGNTVTANFGMQSLDITQPPGTDYLITPAMMGAKEFEINDQGEYSSVTQDKYPIFP